MSVKYRILLVVAVLWICVNAWGAWMAISAGEMLHTAIHVVLGLPVAYLLPRLARRAGGRQGMETFQAAGRP